ncbi:hypothetical protein KI387_043943 [Taxus chinensis]|uniref:Uncharacterized protein n=1 Tax=Taxus chinensis TaxID=29808 RepID=A0AA38LH20_TAXCH|nr:hypothetical protein KI387_043943 [Taxus chinensis]
MAWQPVLSRTPPFIHGTLNRNFRVVRATLLISLLFMLVDMLVLEPRTTKVIFEKLRIEKEEGRGTDIADVVDHPRHRPANDRNGDDVTKYRMVLVNRKLKILHRVSSL